MSSGLPYPSVVLLETLLAKYGGRALSFGIGYGLGVVSIPLTRGVLNELWHLNTVMPVAVFRSADTVAQFPEEMKWGITNASYQGISEDNFKLIVRSLLQAPGAGQLLQLRRLNLIDDATLTRGFRKHRFEPEWDEPLKGLLALPITPQEAATAIQRGIIPNEGQLPESISFAGSDVTPMPVVPISGYESAKAWAYGHEQLDVLARIVGLPPAPGELMMLLNRGTINAQAFRMGIAEGNTRNEWADVLMTLRRRLLSPHEYAELRLRGWIDDAAMYAGAALSGMEPADTKLLHEMLGRPIPVHQVQTGEARGGVFDGPTDHIPAEFVRTLEEGNLRPEWYNLAYANRHSLPGYFVMRELLREGAITRDEGATLFRQIGWPEDLAVKVSASYATSTGKVANPHVAKAETQLWTATHRSFTRWELDEPGASANLAALGVDAAAQAEIIRLWTVERDLVRRLLSPAQIKKAFEESTHSKDPAIQQYTREFALGELVKLGLSREMAGVFLDE